MISLTKIVETYIADSEDEAKKLIEDAKVNPGFKLTGYKNKTKEKKSKGEVEYTYQMVELTKEIPVEGD